MNKIQIQVLGAGCKTCKELHEKVVEVAERISSDLEVEYITDIAKIVELGVMSSPVLVVNEKIISAGKVPTEEEMEKVILGAVNS